MKSILCALFIFFFVCFISAEAQELNCRVQVNSQQIQGTDNAVYENFRKSVEVFLNTKKWSALQLRNNEKIECSFMFVFKSREGDLFTCDMQIQSQRPVYGSTLSTNLLNMREEIKFEYTENKVIEFNESMIDDNLSASLAFWAYIIIGLDFDSFSKTGGSAFYGKAQEIATVAQGGLGDLWKGQDDKNHWGWINSLNDENFQQYRILSYEYHRLGLDLMHKDVESGKAQIVKSLELLKSIKQLKPRTPLLANFLDTKADELANIFSKSNVQEKNSIHTLLTEIYPASGNRLQGIKNRQ